ncbi:reverse transcriptase [Phytophthora megakarya]|uniref:Reverse transcriptase n=1 Tax=Phytophthora megakarya TaxID=4795 RepID=A0A225WV44_9STRA|nr:reverse transcriptase [Phytophthora megakarya]
MKMAARFRQHTWHAKRTTSGLFKSTSLKYADNNIPKLHDAAPVDDVLRWTTGHRVNDAKQKDITATLTPILTILLNLWYEAGVFPDAFLEADIFCLKKLGDTSNPLNYRPLALLNSDYKIFTRPLATRVSNTLPALIHEHQKEALALLLDFQKAYDSLERNYLIRSLVAHGYPAQFITVVKVLHNGTRVPIVHTCTRSFLSTAGPFNRTKRNPDSYCRSKH